MLLVMVFRLAGCSMAGAVRGIGDLFGLSFVGMEEVEC